MGQPGVINVRGMFSPVCGQKDGLTLFACMRCSLCFEHVHLCC